MHSVLPLLRVCGKCRRLSFLLRLVWQLRPFDPFDSRVALVGNGAGLKVTEENKRDYVDKLVHWRLFASMAPQVHLVLGLSAY